MENDYGCRAPLFVFFDPIQDNSAVHALGSCNTVHSSILQGTVHTTNRVVHLSSVNHFVHPCGIVDGTVYQLVLSCTVLHSAIPPKKNPRSRNDSDKMTSWVTWRLSRKTPNEKLFWLKQKGTHYNTVAVRILCGKSSTDQTTRATPSSAESVHSLPQMCWRRAQLL